VTAWAVNDLPVEQRVASHTMKGAQADYLVVQDEWQPAMSFAGSRRDEIAFPRLLE